MHDAFSKTIDHILNEATNKSIAAKSKLSLESHNYESSTSSTPSSPKSMRGPEKTHNTNAYSYFSPRSSTNLPHNTNARSSTNLPHNTNANSHFSPRDSGITRPIKPSSLIFSSSKSVSANGKEIKSSEKLPSEHSGYNKALFGNQCVYEPNWL